MASIGIARIALISLAFALSSSLPRPVSGEDSASVPGKSAEEQLPRSADLRPKFDAWGLTRRLQGARGTCSVFVVTSAIEYALARRQDRGTLLSVEFLNWASNEAIRRSDDGGNFADLWKGFAARGICAEELFPYRAAFDPELRPSADAIEAAEAALGWGLRIHWIKRWDPNCGLSPGQLAEVRRTLASGWPVCGGFLWPKKETWEKGVLQICPRQDVRDGHSVLLVGYEDDAEQPGGGTVFVRNSTGRDGRLTYEYLLAYMNDAMWIEIRFDEPSSPIGALADPLGSMPAIPRGRNRRISSNEQPRWDDGNSDMTMLAPGESLELPTLEGPGAITHIWMTSHAGRANELDSLALRIYWDGRKEPGVEAPLGDFFAVGQGRPAPLDSIPVQVSESGSLSCYWRMPFARSARIVVTNENPDRAAGLYWQVDWVALDELPPGTPYFHARFRREHPAASGRNYKIAEISGRGYYVGTILSVTLAQDGWFGEGDDFFYIDGEPVPSLQGTGSEDYFNDAWGFRRRISPWFGQPRWQGHRAGDSGCAYRWHILDPVAFAKSLRVEIEHKGNRDLAFEGFYIERADFFSSVAFWYQVGEPGPWEPMPPYPERRVPWKSCHLVRAFREAKVSGGAGVRVATEGLFGARPFLAWPNREAGARLSLPFTVEEEGRHAVQLTALGSPGYGLYDIELDGKAALSADFRSEEESELDLLLGTHALASGAHTLSFVAREAPGRPAAPMAVEALRLLKLPAEATRKVKGRNEAHFIRLGIGRAVYAYRLAWGELPESLEALVRSGFLAERYLRDENDLPLASKREGDSFVVESKGPAPWTHRWRGLDARR